MRKQEANEQGAVPLKDLTLQAAFQRKWRRWAILRSGDVPNPNNPSFYDSLLPCSPALNSSLWARRKAGKFLSANTFVKYCRATVWGISA